MIKIKNDVTAFLQFHADLLPVRFDHQEVSVQEGTAALVKAHTRFSPYLSSLPKVAWEIVPVLAWLFPFS